MPRKPKRTPPVWVVTDTEHCELVRQTTHNGIWLFTTREKAVEFSTSKLPDGSWTLELDDGTTELRKYGRALTISPCVPDSGRPT